MKKELEVTISITLNKKVKILIDNNSKNDLKKIIKKQFYLPQDAGKIMQNSDVSALECIADDFLNWDVENFKVII